MGLSNLHCMQVVLPEMNRLFIIIIDKYCSSSILFFL